MNTIYPMYPEAAHQEVTRRLRAANDERRRRLARQSFRSRSRTGAARMSR